MTPELIAEGDARMANADAYGAAVAGSGESVKLLKRIRRGAAEAKRAEIAEAKRPWWRRRIVRWFVTQPDMEAAADEIQRLGEEIERLREALERISTRSSCPIAAGFARAALKDDQ